jgi:hypothetical protein
MQTNMTAFLNEVRRRRQMEAVNAWFMVEFPKSLSTTYWGQARPSAAAGGGAEP